jgi:CHASE3 domain sensor protein
MTDETGEMTKEMIESLAFVDSAIKLDKERFLEMTRHVNGLIEFLENSRANPVTIYYVTRALEGYASDKLASFGQAVEKGRSEESTVTADSIMSAADKLFAMALEDAAKLTKEEQQALVEQQLARKRAAEIGYV